MPTKKNQGRASAQQKPSRSSNAQNKPSAERRNAQEAAGSETRKSGEGQTGERDENYNLVSVLYHALQSAETMTQYARDAEESSDQDLTSFFEEVRENEVRVAQRARALLADRLRAGAQADEDDDDEDEDEDEDESATA